MSLFGSNNSNSGGKNNMFRDADKIISVTNIVTTVVTVNVTDKIEKLHLLYDNMYNDVGITIKNIFGSFVNGSSDLQVLLNYDNYNILADRLYSHLNESNVNFEKFRNLLVDAVEGVKHSNNRIKEQEHAYLTLLYAYNYVVSQEVENTPLLEAEESLSVTADVKEEILEYIRRGYQIVDDDGNLIPIDMNVLAQIRIDLEMT